MKVSFAWLQNVKNKKDYGVQNYTSISNRLWIVDANSVKTFFCDPTYFFNHNFDEFTSAKVEKKNRLEVIENKCKR